jgi:plasmid stability protein
LPVTRTLSNGRSSGDELRDILGKPLEPVERDKALAIVRSDDGIESTLATGEVYAEQARDALVGFADDAVVRALRDAPGALLQTAVAAL